MVAGALADNGSPHMPAVSEVQRRAMFAAASGKSTLGIPQKVGKEFAAADQGGKLPARKKPGARMQRAYASGRISDKAMKKAGY